MYQFFYIGSVGVLVGVDVKTDADGYRIVCCDAWIKSWLGLRQLSREFECDAVAAFSNVTFSRSGLFCSSHLVRGDFFFLRLKKQQHLKKVLKNTKINLKVISEIKKCLLCFIDHFNFLLLCYWCIAVSSCWIISI